MELQRKKLSAGEKFICDSCGIKENGVYEYVYILSIASNVTYSICNKCLTRLGTCIDLMRENTVIKGLEF